MSGVKEAVKKEERELKDKLTDILGQKLNRQLLYYLDICTRCSLCKEACHIYKATGRPEHVPSYRAEALRRIYKRCFTPGGKHAPGLGEAAEIDEKSLEELRQAAYACTGCRRCMVYCPFGIDITWLNSAAKAMLVAAGKAPEILEQLTDAAIIKGENIEIYKDLMIDQIKELEAELKEKTKDPQAIIPIDKEGADVLYVALAGAHSILPAAIVFSLAKENWTLSLFEAANYGYFLGDTGRAHQIAKRIVDEAKRLKVKEVVITECGHAYRVFKHLDEVWGKEKYPFKVISIFEIFDRYLREGRLKVDPSRTKEPVTYHDPCQLGRNAGVFEEPRQVVKQIVSDFREMTPNRGKNWCCGAGGGLVAQEDLTEYRATTGKMKAEQIRATGAKIVATPCENCRLQLELLDERYGLGIKVVAVTDLLVDSLVVV